MGLKPFDHLQTTNPFTLVNGKRKQDCKKCSKKIAVSFS